MHVYDSMLHSMPMDAKMQIAAILAYIECRLHHVQHQEGTLYCGLYSIAYAVDLAQGDDPASFKYEQNRCEHSIAWTRMN